MNSQHAIVALSLLVGAAIGVTGATLVRGGPRPAGLRVTATCQPFDPQGPFLGPTGVHVDLTVELRSAVEAERSPDLDALLEATFILPPRWTAYASSRSRETTDPADGTTLVTFQLPIEPPMSSYRSVREGRTRSLHDVLGPTDAGPDRFSVEVVMRDIDGGRIVRTIDDPCPLPAGPLHEPEIGE